MGQDPFAQYAVKKDDDPFAAYAEKAADSGVPVATAADMLTRRGISSDTTDTPERFSGLHQMLSSAAQPETAGDMLSLLIPTGVSTAMEAIKGYGQAAGAAIREGSSIKQLPGRMLGKLYNKAFPEAEAGANATWTQKPDPPRPNPPPPIEPHLDLSRQVKAGSMSQAQIRERVDLAGAENYQPPPQPPKPMLSGRLRMAPPPEAPLPPSAAPPIQVDTASLPEAWKPLASEPPSLQGPRVAVGAEQVGRGAGMSKQAVRDVTAPILGEAQGAASPILPEAALTRIIDTIKALPPGGPEREAFVARATSGKTQWQVENIRRTLEHLGLIVPVAAGAGMLRGRLQMATPDATQP